MSKAEDRYLEHFQDGRLRNCSSKDAFLLGYHQAEKDLELGWDDISELNCLLNEVEKEFKKGMHEDKSYIGYCQEVLKRFKEDT